MSSSIPLATLTAGLLLTISGAAIAGPDHAHEGDTVHDHAHERENDAKPARTLEEILAESVTKPELWIGMKAPELQIAQFMRGEEITSFEPGHIYVVEFWATWCGPCIAAFPHISELQEEYKGDVSVIGVNVWERSTGQERTDLVQGFVEDHEEMAYSVALEEGSAMSDGWLVPAGQNGIPAAFIVNGEGNIAWIGHPMAMDEPLAQIVAGEYDIEAGAEAAWNTLLADSAIPQLQQFAMAGDADRASELGTAMIAAAGTNDPQMANAASYLMLITEDMSEAGYAEALVGATNACEATEWGVWMTLDTYALALHKNGRSSEAVEWQEKAIELAPAQYKDQLGEQLAEIQEAAG